MTPISIILVTFVQYLFTLSYIVTIVLFFCFVSLNKDYNSTLRRVTAAVFCFLFFFISKLPLPNRLFVKFII